VPTRPLRDSGSELVVLVEGGIVGVVDPPELFVVLVASVLEDSVGSVDVVEVNGVDVIGEVDVVDEDDEVVELVLGVVVLVDDEPPVVELQWSSLPEALPWSSHSCPFVFGSVRQG
jgi:hypothetical protein